MSSILKALKKLEDEKVTRKPDSLKIDAEILRSGSSSNLSSFKAVILGAMLVACGATATYFYMKNSPTASVAPVASGTAASVPFVASPALPVGADVPVSGVPTVRITPENIVPAKAESSRESSAVTPLKIAAKKTAQQPTVSGRAALLTQTQKPQTKLQYVQPVRKTGDEKPSQPLLTKQMSSAPVVPAASGSQLPSIKVSGIAYQDGIDSVAMVNGIMASSGTVVEGVRVEKIQKDRVLFSYGAEKFEVLLGKSNK